VEGKGGEGGGRDGGVEGERARGRGGGRGGGRAGPVSGVALPREVGPVVVGKGCVVIVVVAEAVARPVVHLSIESR